MIKKPHIDRTFLALSLALTICGFFIFTSASLGLLARDQSQFGIVALKQLLIGVVLGGVALFSASVVHYKHWRSFAFYFFLFSLALTCLVFVPHIGFEHGGARRWIAIGSFSFQPSEILKLGYVLYLATWLAMVKDKVREFKFGLLPFGVLSGICGVVLLLQPDTDTFLIMLLAGIAMLIVAGVRVRDLAVIFLIGVIAFGGLVMMRPYLLDRVKTFFDVSGSSALGTGYQVRQSMIAIGSGGFTGRGFGQSVQKYKYLPEPIGDSIFAVFGEEFGFIGSVLLIALFVAFTLQGLRIAARGPDIFSGYLVVGLIILIISQSFINIASMLSLFPLSGIPLVFVSQGGTALLIALLEVGIILNISKYQKV